MLMALVGVAFPCANIVTAEGELATSDAQEALIRSEGGAVVVDYRVEYDGDAGDFGWIIAVPGELIDVDDGQEAVFEELRELSQPRVQYEWAGDSGSGSGPICGCGGMAKGGDNALRGGDDTGSLIEQVAEGFTGTYSWVAVQSEDSEALQEWLSTEGFELLEGNAIDEYVAEEATFVLVSLGESGGDTPPEGRVLPPLSLSYTGSMAFPARMAQGSMAEEMSTRLYVLGDQAATMSGWSYRDLEWLEASEAPAVAWQEAMREHGVEQAYARVFVGAHEGQVLTRFETVAPVSVHTADPVVALDGGDTTFQAWISVWGEPGDSGAAWLLLLPLAGIGWSLRRRD